MNLVMVASVPHTGSHFVVDLLDYPVRDRSQCGETVQHLLHVYRGGSLERIVDHGKAGGTIVVPLRHPRACAVSWANRGKPIAEHPVHAPMIELWRNLIDFIDPFKPLYLPLDTPDRDNWLAKLADRLGKRLKTQWNKVGHHPGNAVHKAEDIEAVDNLLADPFFDRFGYA